MTALNNRRGAEGQRSKGALALALVLLLTLSPFLLFSGDAATVTGIIKDRRGNLVSTNINFRSLQRPIFITPWIQPGWNVSTNSDTNGVFTVSLTAGEYGVAIGNDQRDSFIIAIPNTSSNYTLAQVITSRLTYTYTFSPQYEQLLNRDVAGGYAGLDSSWGRLPSWLLGTNAPSAGDTLYSDGTHNYWAAPGTGSGADASIGYVVGTSNTLWIVINTASNALQTQITAAPTTSQLLAASNALNAKIDLRLTTVQFLADSNNLVAFASGVTNSSLVRQTQLTAASNAIVALIGSGGAGNAVTNNETRDLVLNGGARFEGATTNANIAYFQDDIVQVAGNAATLGNVSVAGTLTVGAATVATLNNLATSSNAIRSAYTTDLLGASNALTTKMELRVAVSDFLLASNALRNDIDLKVTTASLNAASNALVTYANGTTNSSIVRQTQLTAASNDLMSAITTLTTALGLKANTTDLVNASNVVKAAIDLKLSVTQFLLDSNTLRTVIAANDTTTSNGVLTAAQTYANSTTNTSIVRQTQLTAASNAIVALIGSGSGNPLTNNDSRDIVLNGGARFEGATTNANIAYFQDDIVQGSGNAATLGNVSVAGTLTVGAATVATLNNLATSSNALQTAITANGTALTTASNALSARVALALTNNDTRAVTFTSDFNVSGDAAFAGPVDITGQLWIKYGIYALSTNVIRSLTEDTAPATNDFLLSWDASANSLKQTALNSLPVSYRTQLAINAASNSIINSGLLMPYDTDLADIAALTTTAYGLNFLQLANGAAVRSYIGAVIGTDVQAQDAELAALAGLSSSEDRLAFWTGVGTASNTVFTAAARALLDDVNAETMRTTLGIDLTTLPTHTQLTAASNTLRSAFVANDTTTSNGLFSVETTRNAAVSNALAALVVANDTTTSNALVTLIDAGGGSSNTNQARFAYLSRYENNTVIARSNRLSFLYWTGGGYAPTAIASNFFASVNGNYVTNAVAGYYQISAGYSFSSPSNNTFAVMVQTNAGHALNLVNYTEHTGGTGAAAVTTNSVSVSGIVYLPANTYVSAFSDYTKSASGDFNFTVHSAHLTILPVDSASSTASSGSGSGSGGSATNALTWIASNAVPVSGSVTGVNFTLSSGLLGSFTNTNGRVDYGLAIDTSILPTQTQLVAASNAVFAAAQSYASGVTNSSIARQTQLTALSNALVSLISSGPTNYALLNADRFINTNTMDYVEWSMGNTTNGVIPWGATNEVTYTPSNSFTITMSGTPPSGMSREIDLLLINTNSSNGYFPTNDLNGGTVYMLPAPSTNRYKFNWKGGRFWISSGQQAETGTNGYMRTRTGVRRTWVIDASYFVTNGLDQAAIPATYTTALNKKPMNALYFDTGATNAGFSISMPPVWDRNDVTLVPVWTCTNGSGNVVFSFATDFTDNDDTLDGAFGSNVNSTDTVLAADDTHVGPAATPTFGNGAATVYGNLSVRLRRSRDHASDTLDAGVFLLRVLLQYTESTTEPVALP